MKIKFWGVRGSTPTPEHRNDRYGGNTACVEIRLANGSLIILDCGSGLRSLGKSLQREFGERPIYGHIFLSHFHWDHIQGIPFFLPLYPKDNIFAFHAVHRTEEEMKGVIHGQMTGPYFPVDMSVLGSTRHYFDLDFEAININGALIRSAPLNHPQGCAGYRIEADGGTFVYATDTEHGSPFHDEKIRELAQDADILVYDAQYTPEEYQLGRKGWGHSTWLEGTRIAKECHVNQLILFHHDPDHDDAFVDSVVEKARGEFAGVAAAAEGMELLVPGRRAIRAFEVSQRPREPRYQIQVPVRVEWPNGGGELEHIEGVAQNISSSGIYFVTPTDVPDNKPLRVEVMVPDEITHRGGFGFRFMAKPIRRRKACRIPGISTGAMGVAARRISHGGTSLK
jgi:phosphoribosyl 1,2-cyclic phosphodiesterase